MQILKEPAEMLLSFRLKNFKSFKEDTTLSLIPAPKQKDLEYSVLRSQGGAKDYTALCSAVMYGPNASGKSNIISAMEVLEALLRRGNIQNVPESTGPNIAVSRLELIPNNTHTTAQPVLLGITFIEHNYQIDFSIEMMIGTFADRNYARSILSESLAINEKPLYIRKNNDIELFVDNIPKTLTIHTSKVNDKFLNRIVTESLTPTDIFLCNGFKTIISPKAYNLILLWFENKFTPVFRANMLEAVKRDYNRDSGWHIEPLLTKAAQHLGIETQIGLSNLHNDDGPAELCSLVTTTHGKGGIVMPVEVFESYGTVRFINLLPFIIQTLQSGGTIIIDEFDASLHPMVLMSIITAFHNPDINKTQAQLIFNTHNPIFLNSNLFRRDEIKFVEKSEENKTSSIYSLADFKTSGPAGVRKGEDYMRNYFINNYGAVKDIDFSTLFKELMEQQTSKVLQDA